MYVSVCSGRQTIGTHRVLHGANFLPSQIVSKNMVLHEMEMHRKLHDVQDLLARYPFPRFALQGIR